MTNFGIDTLKQGTASWGIELSSGQLAQFQHYAELIHEWNQRTNLTSVEPPEFGTRHFLDSVSILTLPEFAEVRTLVDVGSGAGLPGLAIKIAKPHLEIVLIESQTKRVAFLKRAIMELGLAGVAVQHGRVERICQSATTLSARFDCAVARAVASLAELHAWVAPLVKDGGLLVAYKAELDRSELNAVKEMPEFKYRTVSVNVEGRDAKRTLVIGTRAARPRSDS